MAQYTPLWGNHLSPQRRRTVKILTILFIVALLISVGWSIMLNISRRYTASIDLADVKMIQLEEPAEGAPCAVVHTTVGDMTFLLYPEEAPQAVENFTNLVESSYYDNTYVFRVEEDVFFAAGSPNADGTLAEGASDTAAESVPRELSQNLWPLRGALCALTTKAEGGFWQRLSGTQEYFNGSRFLVLDSIEMTDEIVEGLRSSSEEENPVAEALIEQGGIPNYAQQMTIFGQLIDGWDVLETITNAPLTGEEGAMRPQEDIQIKSVEMQAYTQKTADS